MRDCAEAEDEMASSARHGMVRRLEVPKWTEMLMLSFRKPGNLAEIGERESLCEARLYEGCAGDVKQKEHSCDWVP